MLNVIFYVAVLVFPGDLRPYPLFICGCNIHPFQGLGKGKLQGRRRGILLSLPIYTSKCLSCSSQFFMYPSGNFLSLIARRFSALFSEFLS